MGEPESPTIYIYIYIYIEINLIDHPAIKWELQIIINDNNSLFDKIYM